MFDNVTPPVGVTTESYNYHDVLDAVEYLMLKHPDPVKVKTDHVFTPGLYSRTIKVPADTYLISFEHKTEHQFLMSSGQIVIYDENGMVFLQGPFLGKTTAGNRRFAKSITEVVWTTFHATDIYPSNNSKDSVSAAIEAVETELYNKKENIYLIKEREEAEECLEQ